MPISLIKSVGHTSCATPSVVVSAIRSNGYLTLASSEEVPIELLAELLAESPRQFFIELVLLIFGRSRSIEASYR